MFTAGQTVRYSNPLAGESALRFRVLYDASDAQPARVAMYLIQDESKNQAFSINPVETVSPDEIEAVS